MTQTTQQENVWQSQPSRSTGLDGLRGIAIILVVLGHLWICHIESSNFGWKLAGQILGNASFGVRLFFVLSGFLITSLLQRECEIHGKISLSNFYMRRILRIFPAFYLFLSTIFVLQSCAKIEINSSQLLLSALYLKNYSIFFGNVSNEGTWFVGHLWTLALEEQFYLIWPWLFVLIPHGLLRWLVLAMLLLSPILRVALHFQFPDQRAQVTMMFHTAADSVLMGCAFAIWSESLRKPLAYITSHNLIVGSIVIFPFVVSPILNYNFGGAYALPFGMTLDAFCAATLTMIIVGSVPLPLYRTVLENHQLQWIGRLSYSIYLWQQLFINPFQKTWNFGAFSGVVFTLLSATLSYYAVEQPMLKLKRYFSST